MGNIYIIAGTSGSGKSTIASRLQRKYPNIRRTVSITTRTPRGGEKYGRDYFFVNLEIFEWLKDTGQLLEHTVYDGNKYATLRMSVEELLKDGYDVLFVVDRYGIESITTIYTNTRTVFLRTKNQEEQHLRLVRRGMDTGTLNERLQVAEEEIAWAEAQAIPVITTSSDIDLTMTEVERVLLG